MGKISKNVTTGLGDAIKEAQDLLNSGVKVKKTRSRSKKEEPVLNIPEEQPVDNSLFASLGIEEPIAEKEEDNRPEWEKRNHKDFDEFCQWEIEKAHYYNKPEPDFDFRNYYAKGQVIYYVRIAERLGEKEIMKLTLRTIYPRSMVGCLEKGYCECVGMNERDLIFLNHHDALQYFNSIKITSKYGDEYDEATGFRKRKKKSKSNDDDSDINDYIDGEEEDTDDGDET